MSRIRSISAATALFCATAWPLRAQIPGNYTLSSNQTFSASVSGGFTIGSGSSTFNLQGRTATFTGAGNFTIQSKIAGPGNVMIDMTDPGASVEFRSGNTYSGSTTVRSGRLVLATPLEGNNGIAGNLVIGGGPNQAVVTRRDAQNNGLIGNNVTVTLAQNGTLEFNRSGGENNASFESFGNLVMNGGTLLNASSSILPTAAHVRTLTLTADSVLDLGHWMTLAVENVGDSVWNPSAILTIKRWSILEPVFLGDITAQQLSQIRFEGPEGVYGAKSLFNGFLIPVPMAAVPEPSVFYAVSLLGAAIVLREWQRHRKG